MANLEERVAGLDHPILFALAITMVVLSTQALVTWGAKELGLHGLAALAQHP